jgi:hypothetical protein
MNGALRVQIRRDPHHNHPSREVLPWRHAGIHARLRRQQIAGSWESNMKKMIALAVLALALVTGTAAVMKTVQPPAATCQTPQCVAPAGFAELR